MFAAMALAVASAAAAEMEASKQPGYADYCAARKERRALEAQQQAREPSRIDPMYLLAAFLIGGAVL